MGEKDVKNTTLSEQIELLEIENSKLLHRLEVVEKELKIRKGVSIGCNTRYHQLREKYRTFKKEFFDNF